MGTKEQFKENKWCGFRQGGKCNDTCGLFCVGLKGCVLHGINMQLREATASIKELAGKLN